MNFGKYRIGINAGFMWAKTKDTALALWTMIYYSRTSATGEKMIILGPITVRWTP